MMPVKENGVVSSDNAASVPSPRKERTFDLVDPDDPEYRKEMQRPAVITEDLNEMERRKRVRQILESKSFRSDLEELVLTDKQVGEEVMRSGTTSFKTLQQLSELILPPSQLTAINSAASNSGNQRIVPVADLRGTEASKYSKPERAARNKLASIFRLVDLFQWSQGIYNHVSMKCNPDNDDILVNPFGLLFHEITASNVVKVDGQGNLLDCGTSGLSMDQSSVQLHAAIHRARPNVRCILHLHNPVVDAVAAMKCGLMPISQEALQLGPISYHDFSGPVSEQSEQESLVHDLGPSNKVLCYRNNGFLICGNEAEEVFHLTRLLTVACDTQIRAARAGVNNLNIPSEEIQQRAFQATQLAGTVEAVAGDASSGTKRWRPGELEWEAWMRVLDNAGYKTGHDYRGPLVKAGGGKNQVDGLGIADIIESASTNKLSTIRAAQEKLRRLGQSGTNYIQVVESDPASGSKKVTRWVESGSPTHASNTAAKPPQPSQPSPPVMNPKEFKQRQQQMKDSRQKERVSAGPQSHILECSGWEEAARIKDATISAAGASLMTSSGRGSSLGAGAVGTASKGIIQREHRDTATVYTRLYQPNPFAHETDANLEQYKKDVEEKLKVDGAKPTHSADGSLAPNADEMPMMNGVLSGMANGQDSTEDDGRVKGLDERLAEILGPSYVAEQYQQEAESYAPQAPAAPAEPPTAPPPAPCPAQTSIDSASSVQHPAGVNDSFSTQSESCSLMQIKTDKHTGGGDGYTQVTTTFGAEPGAPATTTTTLISNDRSGERRPSGPQEEQPVISEDEATGESTGSPTKKGDKKKKFKTPGFLKKKKKGEE